MSKKDVLIIETPENCAECPCSNDCVSKCEITGKELDGANANRRKPGWCPLTPLPELMTPVGESMFEYGWNSVLFAMGGYDE